METKCSLNDSDLLERAHESIRQMSVNSKWPMSIPVDFDRDSDMLLIEVCKRLTNRNEQHFKMSEALKTVVRGYETDGMEQMGTRDEVFYKICKQTIKECEL